MKSPSAPSCFLKIVGSYYKGMGGSLSKVRNSLRKGCTLASTLFNLYFSAVVTT